MAKRIKKRKNRGNSLGKQNKKLNMLRIKLARAFPTKTDAQNYLKALIKDFDEKLLNGNFQE